jgi:Protein of unknown function (DUF1488)
MIDFGTSENWVYNSSRDTVTFHVYQDGSPITCRVSMEAITDHFGFCDSDDEVLQKAKENFDEITDQIGYKIARGQFEEGAEVVLRSQDW